MFQTRFGNLLYNGSLLGSLKNKSSSRSPKLVVKSDCDGFEAGQVPGRASIGRVKLRRMMHEIFKTLAHPSTNDDSAYGPSLSCSALPEASDESATSTFL